MAPKIDAKSLKNRGCVADAILERFGTVFGAKKGDRKCYGGPRFGDHFRAKVEKRH